MGSRQLISTHMVLLSTLCEAPCLWFLSSTLWVFPLVYTDDMFPRVSMVYKVPLIYAMKAAPLVDTVCAVVLTYIFTKFLWSTLSMCRNSWDAYLLSCLCKHRSALASSCSKSYFRYKFENLWSMVILTLASMTSHKTKGEEQDTDRF